MTTTEHHAIDLSNEQVETLDNLVWRSLTSTHSRFAQGGGLARRFDPDVAGFVVLKQPTQCAWADLRRLVGPGELVMLSGGGDIEPPADWPRIGGGFGNQMILDRLIAPPATDDRIEPLTSAHVPQMLALVELTQPGPFRPRTIELGDYFGVFDDGELIAMAGERLQTPEFTEVSAVCTHPSARGRGLAAALSHHVATGILARGQIPILHVAQANVGARRVYERLGFVVRRELEFVAVETPAKHPTPDPDCDEPGTDAPVKFIVIRLLTNSPDPDTGRRATATEVLGDAIEEATYFEDLGFDGYGIGEHHIDDAEASSPAVILGYLASSTKRIRLFTGVTVLSLLDPVRVAEDYATVDVLSGGRIDLIIGKGNTEEQSKVFGYTNDDQWERNRENYELLHRLLREEKVTWKGVYRPALEGFTSRPCPVQQPIRVWHGSATSTQSTDLAAKWGDPLFSANVSGPLEQYQTLVDDYRKRWVDYGRDPADAMVGAGSAGLHVHPDSQRAIEEFRPRYEANQAFARRLGVPPTFASLEDAIERGSYFVGSPAQVIDQVHRYHEALGHEVQHTAGIGRPDDPTSRAGIELFAAEVLPDLQRDIPDRLWDRWPDASEHQATATARHNRDETSDTDTPVTDTPDNDTPERGIR